MQARAFTMRGAAGFSSCGRYRYWLTRTWDESRSVVCWLMLNPSTADGTRNDPTIRRCVGLSRHWGHGGIVVVNLFAWRATDARELMRVVDPVGPANDAVLKLHTTSRRVIAAWGNQGGLLNRVDAVLSLLAECLLECLGLTSVGQPRHPLYVAANTKPVRFVPQVAGSLPRQRFSRLSTSRTLSLPALNSVGRSRPG
jgi:hypothetical protein